MTPMLRFLGATFLAILMVGGLLMYQEHKDRQDADEVESATDVIDVTARELEKAYAENEVAADERYRGKVLRVSGVIDQISKDALGEMVVMLRSPNVMGGVHCTFDDKQKSQVASLKKGQKVTLRGRGTGVALGAPTLSSCSVD